MGKTIRFLTESSEKATCEGYYAETLSHNLCVHLHAGHDGVAGIGHAVLLQNAVRRRLCETHRFKPRERSKESLFAHGPFRSQAKHGQSDRSPEDCRDLFARMPLFASGSHGCSVFARDLEQ